MGSTVEEELYEAVYAGGAEEVSSLLRDNPGLDVNWAGNPYNALHLAALHSQDEIVEVLLAHPTSMSMCETAADKLPFHLVVEVAWCRLLSCC